MKPPKFLKEYFWEVDFGKLDVNRYSSYIIARLMEYGNLRAIKWLKGNFPKRHIDTVLKGSRELSKKSAVFWALVQGVEEKDILCLSKAYREKRKTAWPY